MKLVPSLCIAETTPKTFCSGKYNLRKGFWSNSLITLLYTLVTPFTIGSLLVIVYDIKVLLVSKFGILSLFGSPLSLKGFEKSMSLIVSKLCPPPET